MYCIFDCETNGKADFKSPASSPAQPEIVQLAAAIYDGQSNCKGEINLIIRPDGWSIPDELVKIHGITTREAGRFGVPLIIALGAFSNFIKICDYAVAFNYDFDALVIEAGCHRIQKPFPMKSYPVKSFCLMKKMSWICKMPKEGKSKFYATPEDPYKWPSLEEAYKHAFNEPMSGAHSAMSDVKNTARLLFWHRQLEIANHAATGQAANHNDNPNNENEKQETAQDNLQF